MSQETLKRAVDLAQRGLSGQALELLRPLLHDQKMKPSAMVAMAFSHERAGNFAFAKYLVPVVE
jgi:hypothetical protein